MRRTASGADGQEQKPARGEHDSRRAVVDQRPWRRREGRPEVETETRSRRRPEDPAVWRRDDHVARRHGRSEAKPWQRRMASPTARWRRRDQHTSAAQASRSRDPVMRGVRAARKPAEECRSAPRKIGGNGGGRVASGNIVGSIETGSRKRWMRRSPRNTQKRGSKAESAFDGRATMWPGVC